MKLKVGGIYKAKNGVVLKAVGKYEYSLGVDRYEKLRLQVVSTNGSTNHGEYQRWHYASFVKSKIGGDSSWVYLSSNGRFDRDDYSPDENWFDIVKEISP